MFSSSSSVRLNTRTEPSGGSKWEREREKRGWCDSDLKDEIGQVVTPCITDDAGPVVFPKKLEGRSARVEALSSSWLFNERCPEEGSTFFSVKQTWWFIPSQVFLLIFLSAANSFDATCLRLARECNQRPFSSIYHLPPNSPRHGNFSDWLTERSNCSGSSKCFFLLNIWWIELEGHARRKSAATAPPSYGNFFLVGKHPQCLLGNKIKKTYFKGNIKHSTAIPPFFFPLCVYVCMCVSLSEKE